MDVNYFPGYKGVPDVAPLIADYIEDYARGRRELALPPLNGEVAGELGSSRRTSPVAVET